MKIFEDVVEGRDWGTKVNFVDQNNVFVGYDTYPQCCENAEWFIADKIATCSQDIPSKPVYSEDEFEDYVFDKEFFIRYDNRFPEESEVQQQLTYFDEGGMVIFRIVSGDKEKFIHLYNCQNGYYGHGFEMKVMDKITREGGL